jgi:hypothetical protein
LLALYPQENPENAIFHFSYIFITFEIPHRPLSARTFGPHQFGGYQPSKIVFTDSPWVWSLTIPILVAQISTYRWFASHNILNLLQDIVLNLLQEVDCQRVICLWTIHKKTSFQPFWTDSCG